MALALWREAPLEEVLRVVCEGLSWLSGGQASAMQATKGASLRREPGWALR